MVHRGTITISADLTHPMDPTGIVKDALAQGSLARVNMSRNADVAKY